MNVASHLNCLAAIYSYLKADADTRDSYLKNVKGVCLSLCPHIPPSVVGEAGRSLFYLMAPQWPVLGLMHVGLRLQIEKSGGICHS